MPSVNSSSRPKVCPSSTFTTPSLPTFSIASERTSPISRSREETVATRAISSLPEISCDCDFRFSTTCSTACSMPRLIAIGFAPAATFLSPSRTIACASTVAVVVPSPATSFVAVATSRTSCAPWFSKTSSTSISRAIVTPSFVIVGAPNFLSSTTYRPFGPRVTLTASARMLTPRSSERRASSLNFNSLCAIRTPSLLRLELQRAGLGRRPSALRGFHSCGSARQLLLLGLLRAGRGDLGEHIGLAQDQHLVGPELDLRPAVLGEDDLVALRDFHRDEVALVVPGARPRGEDAAALRLLLGGVGEDDPADGRFLVFEDLDDQAVSQW